MSRALEPRNFAEMAAEMAASMVDTQMRQRGIRDTRVLDAMSRLPRHEFVPEHRQPEAYSDTPVAIGYGQTISQPYITALMAQLLELRGDERVLDVGSGSGYGAALLGDLAREVISIERIPELAAIARANLQRSGLDRNITVICGDGSLGAQAFAPFDAIFVAAASPWIPAALTAQLADPGILVIPAGTREDQKLQVVRKEFGKLTARQFSGCRFVPLLGRDAF